MLPTSRQMYVESPARDRAYPPARVTQVEGAARERVSVTGIRLTQGDAVECPRILDDDGVVHTVSYLSPSVPVGARVSVRGHYAVTTNCLGTVLVVEEERIPAQ